MLVYDVWGWPDGVKGWPANHRSWVLEQEDRQRVVAAQTDHRERRACYYLGHMTVTSLCGTDPRWHVKHIFLCGDLW